MGEFLGGYGPQRLSYFLCGLVLVSSVLYTVLIWILSVPPCNTLLHKNFSSGIVTVVIIVFQTLYDGFGKDALDAATLSRAKVLI
jgi:hypothetical protein